MQRVYLLVSLAIQLWLPQVFCLHELLAPKPAVFAIESRSDISSSKYIVSPRQLVSAQSAAGLRARGTISDGFLKHSHVLHFIDEYPGPSNRDATHGEQAPFAAHVHVTSTLPTLLLEDSDSHLERIACYGSTIELSFRSASALSLAWAELAKHEEMLVITSHPGCNADGERSPFLVAEAKKTSTSLILSVTPKGWKDAFHTIDVHFGSGMENTELKPRDYLRKRQTTPSTTTSAAPISSKDFPPAPSDSPTSTSVADASVDKQYLDTAILPPEFPGIDLSSLSAPFVPQGFTVGCKNCTIQGNIDISQGYFTINDPGSNSNDSDIEDLLTEGYVELQVNNFATHIELESTIQASASLVTYVAPFPDIGIPGFSIPGLASVGPVLRPEVSFGAAVSSELEFTYGFNLSIPNNSTITLNIANQSESTITGFQDTKFSTLPFQSQLNNVNLTLSAAFTPQLLLTISVLNRAGSISAGAFLDLPALSATVAQVNNVNDKCELNPNTNTNTTTNDDNNIKDFPFTSLTHITSSVDANVGVLVEAEFEAGSFNISNAAAYTAWSTAYPLPTACFRYDEKAKGYVEPMVEGKEEGKAETGGAGEGMMNPLTGLGGVKGMMLLMGLVFVGFVTL